MILTWIGAFIYLLWVTSVTAVQIDTDDAQDTLLDSELLQSVDPAMDRFKISPDGEKLFHTTWQQIARYLRENWIPGPPPSDIYLNTPELIEKYGYSAETHYITTEDGYILTYHRIPHGKTPPAPGVRPIPVLIQHGIFSESTHFLTQPDFNCLPYILADAGYDVWMGNARGNRYSRGNVRYSTLDWQFWLTEWHEMGLYDVSAGIDYILERTGFTKVNYVAHSMGNSMMLALLSLKPEYNQKLNYMISLAPAIFMTHTASPIRAVAPIVGAIGGLQEAAAKAGKGEFFPNYIFRFLEHIYGPVCEPGITGVICSAIYFAIVGFDYTLLNMTHLPVMMATFPSSNPTATMIHFFQEMDCPEPCFKQIDKGIAQNLISYGSPYPPSYDLSRATVPKTIFYGYGDILVAWQDVELTKGLIPNTNYTVMSFPKWNHMDFLWAQNAYSELHPQILCILKAHDSGFS